MLGPPSPRDQFWAKQRRRGRYVQAMSQRSGMRRTLCSRLCQQTCRAWGAAGLDFTARAALPRAAPGPGLSSPAGDPRRPRGGRSPPQISAALPLKGPGSPSALCGSQGSSRGVGGGGGSASGWNREVERSLSHSKTLRVPWRHYLGSGPFLYIKLVWEKEAGQEASKP